MADEMTKLDVDELLDRYLATEKLDIFFDLLMKENQNVNLVSRETSRDDLRRLAAESVLPLEMTPGPFSRYVDVGSGGGFPAVPLVLTRKVMEETILVERTQKKAAALKRISDLLGLPGLHRVQISNKTFEELPVDRPYDLITIRYVKLTPTLLKHVLKHLHPAGVCIYYSRPHFEPESCSIEVYPFAVPQGSDPSPTPDSQDQVIKHFTLLRKTQ
ncbi:hypothetical protein GF377_06810 [candidate division GN15 bacterium]|nr:hypothetical protein [candidate division GN15 bacterium]